MKDFVGLGCADILFFRLNSQNSPMFCIFVKNRGLKIELLARKTCTNRTQFKCFKEFKGRSNKQKWKTVKLCLIIFYQNLGQKSIVSEPSSLRINLNVPFSNTCLASIVN